jgi:hypothetical protein
LGSVMIPISLVAEVMPSRIVFLVLGGRV